MKGLPDGMTVDDEWLASLGAGSAISSPTEVVRSRARRSSDAGADRAPVACRLAADPDRHDVDICRGWATNTRRVSTSSPADRPDRWRARARPRLPRRAVFGLSTGSVTGWPVSVTASATSDRRASWPSVWERCHPVADPMSARRSRRSSCRASFSMGIARSSRRRPTAAPSCIADDHPGLADAIPTDLEIVVTGIDEVAARARDLGRRGPLGP